MKHRFSWLLVASCVLLVAVVIFLRNTTKEQAENTAKSPPPVAAVKAPVPRNHSEQTSGPNQEKQEDLGVKLSGQPVTKEAILAQIEEASVTYDPKALPLIEPYLLHSDPAIREAAKDGMINLGDAAAGPLLREASLHAPTPQEAAVLSQAADYVELPPANVTLKKPSATALSGTEKPTLKQHKPERHGLMKQDKPTTTTTE